MEPTHGSATAFGVRVALKHVSGEVLRVRVVDHVHADRCRAMVFGDGYSATKAHFQPGTGAAAAAEEIHDDLIVLLVEAKAVLGFEIEGVFLVVYGHRGSSPACWFFGLSLVICRSLAPSGAHGK